MERAGRILAIWIVGCIIPGIVLISAHVALPGQAWTSDEEWWFRFGLALIFFAVAGIVGELALVVWTFRRPAATPPDKTEAAAVPARESPELASARQRLAELETKDRIEQRRMFGSALQDRANYVRGMRTDYERPAETFHGRQGQADAWARVIEWNDETSRLLNRGLPDESALADDFDRPIDPTVTPTDDWRVAISTYIETKAKRLERIARVLQGTAG
jgi:hypothetical protein